MQTKLLNKYAHQIAHNQACREQLATRPHAAWENRPRVSARLW